MIAFKFLLFTLPIISWGLFFKGTFGEAELAAYGILFQWSAFVFMVSLCIFIPASHSDNLTHPFHRGWIRLFELIKNAKNFEHFGVNMAYWLIQNNNY